MQSWHIKKNLFCGSNKWADRINAWVLLSPTWKLLGSKRGHIFMTPLCCQVTVATRTWITWPMLPLLLGYTYPDKRCGGKEQAITEVQERTRKRETIDTKPTAFLHPTVYISQEESLQFNSLAPPETDTGLHLASGCSSNCSSHPSFNPPDADVTAHSRGTWHWYLSELCCW